MSSLQAYRTSLLAFKCSKVNRYTRHWYTDYRSTAEKQTRKMEYAAANHIIFSSDTWPLLNWEVTRVHSANQKRLTSAHLPFVNMQSSANGGSLEAARLPPTATAHWLNRPRRLFTTTRFARQHCTAMNGQLLSKAALPRLHVYTLSKSR